MKIIKKRNKIKRTNKLDEMQEQKMLKIEHNGCWLAFWGLFVSLLVQALIYERSEWRYVAVSLIAGTIIFFLNSYLTYKRYNKF